MRFNLINYLRETAKCDCGYFCEDAVHFFFQCPRFNDIRFLLFQSTRFFHPLNIPKLLYGSAALTYDENCDLVNNIHIYIKNSKRFDSWTIFIIFELFLFAQRLSPVQYFAISSTLPLEYKWKIRASVFKYLNTLYTG